MPPIPSPIIKSNHPRKTRTYATANPPPRDGETLLIHSVFRAQPSHCLATTTCNVSPPQSSSSRCHRLRRRRPSLRPFHFLTTRNLPLGHTRTRTPYIRYTRWWCRWRSAADQNRPSSYPAQSSLRHPKDERARLGHVRRARFLRDGVHRGGRAGRPGHRRQPAVRAGSHFGQIGIGAPAGGGRGLLEHRLVPCTPR